MNYQYNNCKCKYKGAFNNSHTPMLIIDPSTGYIDDVNLAACNFYGYSREEFLSMDICDVSLSNEELILKEVGRTSHEDTKLHRLKHRLSNGELKDVEVYSELIEVENKELIFSVIYDVHEKAKLKEDHKLSKAYFDNLFHNSPEAIAIVDKEFKILDINENFQTVFLYDLDEIRDKDITEILCEENSYNDSYNFRESIAGGKFIKEEVRRRRKNGELVDVLLMGFPLVIEGQTIGAYCIYSDITEVKDKEMQIQILKNFDSLTGLFSKDYFMRNLNHEIENNNGPLAILVLGINEYKEIYEALGYQVGEKVIKEFGHRLRASIRREAVIARLTEDEFAISIPNIMDFKNLQEVVDEVKEKIEDSMIIEGKEIKITPSIGISLYPDDGIESIGLVGKAGIAMSKSRTINFHSPIRFNNSLVEEVQEYFWIKTDLMNAISKDELFLNYQPIYNTVTNKLIGVEALLRWSHSERGLIPPAKFIPIAEKNGLIHSIGEWVLLKACKQNKEWQRLGYEPIYISVNVSILQLEQLDFCDKVRSILLETKLEPKYLQLEITETFFTQNYKSIERTVKKLSELGIRIAIDDFGTGYSSLGQLCEMNINSLKIDRMFIDEVDKNTNKSKIVKAVISLAESLNINLTAEGVETIEQLKFLKENKCIIAQGFLFSKPVEQEKIEKLLS